MNYEEKAIIKDIILRAFKQGCRVSVYDGEEWVLEGSHDVEEILGMLGTTEADCLRLINNIGGNFVGSIDLVYGNAPDEVVCDYSWDSHTVYGESRMKTIVDGEAE